MTSCDFHVTSVWSACRLREGDGGSAYDTQSSSVIRLNNSSVLYLREVNKYLALVCLLREDSFEKPGQLASLMPAKLGVQRYQFSDVVCVCRSGGLQLSLLQGSHAGGV